MKITLTPRIFTALNFFPSWFCLFCIFPGVNFPYGHFIETAVDPTVLGPPHISFYVNRTEKVTLIRALLVHIPWISNISTQVVVHIKLKV